MIEKFPPRHAVATALFFLNLIVESELFTQVKTKSSKACVVLLSLQFKMGKVIHKID